MHWRNRHSQMDCVKVRQTDNVLLHRLEGSPGVHIPCIHTCHACSGPLKLPNEPSSRKKGPRSTSLGPSAGLAAQSPCLAHCTADCRQLRLHGPAAAPHNAAPLACSLLLHAVSPQSINCPRRACHEPRCANALELCIHTEACMLCAMVFCCLHWGQELAPRPCGCIYYAATQYPALLCFGSGACCAGGTDLPAASVFGTYALRMCAREAPMCIGWPSWVGQTRGNPRCCSASAFLWDAGVSHMLVVIACCACMRIGWTTPPVSEPHAAHARCICWKQLTAGQPLMERCAVHPPMNAHART